jgi:hypothetical protein
MSSLNSKDRVSLCLFTFTDGRRCRTPRTARHPHFCFYHAQKEARAQAAEKLAEDLAYFFSGDYLSACDLSTALSRLIPAVIRGDIRPKLGRTVAYMCQTLMQTIHLSQDEYINAFDSDGWREAVRKSVNMNSDYDNPQPEEADEPDEPEPQQPQPRQSQPQSRAGAPASTSSTVAARLQPATSAPATSATVTQTTTPPNARPSRRQQSAAAAPQPRNASRPSPATVEEALAVARSLFPSRPSSTPAQSAAPIANSAASEACHPERSEGPRLNPTSSTTDETRRASGPAESTQLNSAPTPAPTPQSRPTTPTRDPYAVHFDHNYRLRIDGKLF